MNDKNYTIIIMRHVALGFLILSGTALLTQYFLVDPPENFINRCVMEDGAQCHRTGSIHSTPSPLNYSRRTGNSVQDVHHYHHYSPFYNSFWYDPFWGPTWYRSSSCSSGSSGSSSGSSNNNDNDDLGVVFVVLFVLVMVPLCFLLHFYTYCHVWNFFRWSLFGQLLILLFLALQERPFTTQSSKVVLLALGCSLSVQFVAMIHPYYLLGCLLLLTFTISTGLFLTLDD